MDKSNNLIYQIKDKPPFGQLILFAIQQLLAIMAATIVVPTLIPNSGLTQAAALCGAGIGTIVYLLFTKSKSPVFLGSSFAFIGSMISAFAGSVSVSLGWLGLVIGAFLAGIVYVIIAVIVKFCGTNWINKLMPAVIIGPTVAIIGLSLAGNAVGDLLKFATNNGESYVMGLKGWICLICGLVTLFVTMISSSYGKKIGKLIPFIFGILAGYAVACIFYIIGDVAEIPELQVIDFTPFTSLFETVTLDSFLAVPEFIFLKAFGAFGELSGSYILTIAVAYVPVAFVVFAEHLADHKNLSSIVGSNLLEEPGLTNTLLGDGIGSFVGALFGGCPNTTYGESIACVAITRNASTLSIWGAAVAAILVSFVSPFMAFLESIPSCVMGGVCIALYGFISVSGLKMIQKVDLGKNHNLFVASIILIAGVGGLQLQIGEVTLRTVACALILGIVANIILSFSEEAKKDKAEHKDDEE